MTMGVEDVSQRFELIDFLDVHTSLSDDTVRLALSGPGTKGLAPITFSLHP